MTGMTGVAGMNGMTEMTGITMMATETGMTRMNWLTDMSRAIDHPDNQTQPFEVVTLLTKTTS